jgi:ribonuclease HI
MSTVKSPSEKKTLSLKRDRRNTYGENAKASRKNIPKGRQTSHQMERRAASAPLAKIKGTVPDEVIDDAEFASKQAVIEKRRKGFKKSPDQPLRLVLKEKATSTTNSWKAFGDLVRKEERVGASRPR